MASIGASTHNFSPHTLSGAITTPVSSSTDPQLVKHTALFLPSSLLTQFCRLLRSKIKSFHMSWMAPSPLTTSISTSTIPRPTWPMAGRPPRLCHRGYSNRPLSRYQRNNRTDSSSSKGWLSSWGGDGCHETDLRPDPFANGRTHRRGPQYYHMCPQCTCSQTTLIHPLCCPDLRGGLYSG